MKYLIILITTILVSSVYVGGCKSLIKTIDHPIDPIKAEKLVTTKSPVLSVNLWHISLMSLIVTIMIIFVWVIGWKKAQKREAVSS